MITFHQIKNNPHIKTYIQKADESLIALGYTEHSFAHVTKVAEKRDRFLKSSSIPIGRQSLHGSPDISTTSAILSTASTTPRAALLWHFVFWTSWECLPMKSPP